MKARPSVPHNCRPAGPVGEASTFTCEVCGTVYYRLASGWSVTAEERPASVRPIARAICDAVYEVDRWSGYPSPKDIQSVAFRRGLGEIDVTYTRESGYDGQVEESTVIPAETVLTALLQYVLDLEKP